MTNPIYSDFSLNLMALGDWLRGFIERWDRLSPLKLYNRATNSVVTYEYSGISMSDYEGILFDYSVPYNDIHIDLLNTSDRYLKGFLINEQLRLMGIEAKTFPQGVEKKWNFSELE